MKRLAAIAAAALLLTGCAAQPSEEWLKAKHECLASTVEHMGRTDGGGPIPSGVKTYADLDKACSKTADKAAGK